MYEDFLGKGYHEKIRHMITADKELLPDSIIDAELNIGAMKQLTLSFVEAKHAKLDFIETEDQLKQLQDAAVYYLSGVICTAMKSRTSFPPYNVKKYKKKWDEKRNSYMSKGNILMKQLLDSVRRW